METVSLTIDGRQVTVEKGKTVLQAAIEAGISVPYYCFHPGLAVDGSCRVCIVKIEKMPKLQTSCSTLCTQGMTRFEAVGLPTYVILHPKTEFTTRPPNP